MLAHRLRRWPIISPILVQYVCLLGKKTRCIHLTLFQCCKVNNQAACTNSSQRTRDVDTMLIQCWAKPNIGPALGQHIFVIKMMGVSTAQGSNLIIFTQTNTWPCSNTGSMLVNRQRRRLIIESALDQRLVFAVIIYTEPGCGSSSPGVRYAGDPRSGGLHPGCFQSRIANLHTPGRPWRQVLCKGDCKSACH